MLTIMNRGHEPLARWGRSFLKLKPGSRMLDLGCGGGANLAALLKMCPDGMAVGLDYSAASVAKASEVNSRAIKEGRCRVVQGDVCDLPFESNDFDQITAFETVYFWPELQEVLRQVLHILKPGGSILICNEANGSDPKQAKWSEMIEGMTLYTGEQLAAMLKTAGFIQVETHQQSPKGWLCMTAQKPATAAER